MLGETDVKDKQGNIVIEPGLKVRHKKSQYEYTVEDVVEDGDGVTVVLRMPEEPRFEPPADAPDVVISDSRGTKSVLSETDPDVIYFEPEDGSTLDTPEDALMAVPQEEFEKDYEVK